MNEKIDYVIHEKRKIIEVLRDLNLLVVSFDRIKSEYLDLPDKKSEEEVDACLVDLYSNGKFKLDQLKQDMFWAKHSHTS